MTKVIAVANRKGGAGKTTTVSALSAGLSHRGFKVLSVDLDAQQNLSFIMGANENAPTAFDMLTNKIEANEAIQHTGSGDIIASSPELATADIIITGEGREFRLKNALNEVAADYDYIILDSPPALDMITVNALTAADAVIIPVQADILSLKGLEQLYQIIEIIRKSSNSALTILGILLTRHSGRSVLSRDLANVFQKAAEQIGTKTFDTTIREAVAIREAQARQKDIFTYAAKSKAAEDYKAFIDEVLQEKKEGKKRHGK